MKNKKIFITGGAGYLGRNIVKRYYKDNQIVVYSRDESKHFYLKKEFPNITCYIGDIRNLDLMRERSKGCNIGIFTASIKHIDTVDFNTEEANKIIVEGALNSRKIAEEHNFESACFISTDKSRSATTIYGAMKFVAGESFIVNDNLTNTNLSVAVYGNVMNSTGSIIPLIWDSIKKGYSLTLFSEEMTRFMISINDAVDLIDYALKYSGYNVIPKIKSFRVKDLFDIYKEKFGLKYNIGKPRISEKIHEIMISEEEVPRITTKDNKYYFMHYKKIFNEVNFKNNQFSSKDYCMNKKELEIYLGEYDFFKQ